VKDKVAFHPEDRIMTLPDFRSSYENLAADLLEKHDESKAMAAAVGGDFEAVGRLEHLLLLQHGLQKPHTVVDVGCGSGRLAVRLKDYLEGKYVGIDVVPELYEYARNISGRPDWEFLPAPGLTIPQPDNSADYICFFSVFTHLLHEESYRYLEDASRVLKPLGKIVFSFLEFRIPSHWACFQHWLADQKRDAVHNQFMSRDGIEAWATHLGLSIVDIADGDKPHIPLNEPIRWDNGSVMSDMGNLGQSVCVLRKA
jgi:SAM-dependent methyltransferase